jgi:hypothetical protein
MGEKEYAVFNTSLVELSHTTTPPPTLAIFKQ